MTKKLYYVSSKVSKWEAKILEIFEEEGFYYILLDETAFYPEGGGQPRDTGTIDGIPILDISLNENGDILHKLKCKPISLFVHCVLDWERRFDHMQQHSGQHLLSAVCQELFQARTVSFHLGQDFVYIDISTPSWTDEQTFETEQLVNQYIYENRKLHTYFVTSDQLQTLPVVKMPTVTEDIRIVEIEGIEYNPCGGTHVEQTGEIGIIKIIKTEKQKDCTRLYFKCGSRALHDFTNSLNILSKLSSKFNTGRVDILNRVEKLENDHDKLTLAYEKLKLKHLEFLAESLLTHNKDGVIHHVFADQTLKELQLLSSTIHQKEKSPVLFVSVKEQKVLLAHDGSLLIHCGDFFKRWLPSYNGKGGGKAKSAQAGFTSQADLMDFYTFAADKLDNMQE
ncbi:alanyl-tRNA editing protein [Peribacillus sp. NPDC097675]|uniref:alanyl-tRNA editing protein n=1 Tax=Peribacillus sp. NPDC097675 TaxID=3390618 RepID=UPI003CFDA99D